MLGKKISSVKKLAKKVKVRSNPNPSQKECLLQTKCDDHEEEGSSSPPQTASPGTPTGHFAVYAGEERRRFVVPTGFLSHPLFKMLLEKAYDEFGFEQRDGLVVPCSVAAFQEVNYQNRTRGGPLQTQQHGPIRSRTGQKPYPKRNRRWAVDRRHQHKSGHRLFYYWSLEYSNIDIVRQFVPME
ncbi:unnamed protein product [Camellia sinensis]